MDYKRTKPGVEYDWAINKEYTLFWQQYKFLVANYWSYYCKLLNKYDLGNEYCDFDDFYYDSWIIIKNSIDSVKPKNILDKDKWFGYMQISFYLRNWINRQLIIKRLRERSAVNVLERNILDEDAQTESTE